jgi:hypothetical protein
MKSSHNNNVGCGYGTHSKYKPVCTCLGYTPKKGAGNAGRNEAMKRAKTIGTSAEAGGANPQAASPAPETPFEDWLGIQMLTDWSLPIQYIRAKHRELCKPMCIHTNCREKATKNYCSNHFGQIQVNWLKFMEGKSAIDEEKLAEWFYEQHSKDYYESNGLLFQHWASLQRLSQEKWIVRAKEAIEYAKRE